MDYRGVINGKAAEHLPYTHFETMLTLSQPGGRLCPPIGFAWLKKIPNYAPGLRCLYVEVPLIYNLDPSVIWLNKNYNVVLILPTLVNKIKPDENSFKRCD